MIIHFMKCSLINALLRLNNIVLEACCYRKSSD